MSFSVVPSDKFKKEAKRLTKKYPSLKTELAGLAQILSANPETGRHWGTGCTKSALPLKAKAKAKAGARGL